MQHVILFLSLFLFVPVSAQHRWSVEPDGEIRWNVNPEDNHIDHIELSGKHISVILTYGIENGKQVSKKQLIFPMLRVYPNDTHGHLTCTMEEDVVPSIKVNGKTIDDKVRSFHIKGMLRSVSETDEISILRTVSPSVDKPVAVEQFTVNNKSKEPLLIEIDDVEKRMRSLAEKSVYGRYEVKASVLNAGVLMLNPGDSILFPE